MYMWQRQLLTTGNNLSRLPQAVPDKLLGKDSYCWKSVLLLSTSPWRRRLYFAPASPSPHALLLKLNAVV